MFNKDSKFALNISNYSKEHIDYVKKIKKRKNLILFTQIFILVMFFILWEVLAANKIVDPFLVSQPSRILKTTIEFYQSNNLFNHIGITLLETVIGFVVGTVVGILIAIALWWSSFLSKVLDPYLVVLNALPKIALGPIIIFWLGNSPLSIIVITLMISLVVTIISVLSGFQEVDSDKIKLLKTFGATKSQILKYVILPASFPSMISALKINVGLSWVGVIVGEFIAGKEGLGFLITFGGQVSQLDMVMMSIIILSILAYLMYEAVSFIEKVALKRHSNQ